MKPLLLALSIVLPFNSLHATEDHLVFVPTPITYIQDPLEHVVVKVPHVSGYSLDFLDYCKHIASPYVVQLNSPSGIKDEADLNPLSRAGLTMAAEEKDNGKYHIVTLDFTKVKDTEDRTWLTKIATNCIFVFADNLMEQPKSDIILKGVAKDSELHAETKQILAKWKSAKGSADK